MKPSITPVSLTLQQVGASSVEYRGKPATKLVDLAPPTAPDGSRLAIVNGTKFQDGTIDLDLAGDTAPGDDPAYRGFVGLAFRVGGSDLQHYECFYLRPKNGHSADPVQRTHAAQYVSFPGWPWKRTRAETPGRYEAAADVDPGEWIHVHIVVAGRSATLFLNGSSAPTLVVNDLKQPIAPGELALWIDPHTIAHFANLTYTATAP